MERGAELLSDPLETGAVVRPTESAEDMLEKRLQALREMESVREFIGGDTRTDRQPERQRIGEAQERLQPQGDRNLRRDYKSTAIRGREQS